MREQDDEDGRGDRGGGGAGEGGGKADSELRCVEVEAEVSEDAMQVAEAEVVMEEEAALVSCKNVLLTCVRKRGPSMGASLHGRSAGTVEGDKDNPRADGQDASAAA